MKQRSQDIKVLAAKIWYLMEKRGHKAIIFTVRLSSPNSSIHKEI